MQEIVVDFLKASNALQLVAIGIMFWFFYNRLDAKLGGRIDKVENSLGAKIDRVENSLNDRIDKVESSLNDKIDKVESYLGSRIDKLSDKVEDIDRRLCRIEGSLATQGHCLFHQNQKSDQTAL